MTTFSQRLTALRKGLPHAAEVEGAMLALGAATGFLTGLLAGALIVIIETLQHWFWGSSVDTWELLVVPTVGAFAVGVIVTLWAPESSGSGVVRTMETIALRGGVFRARVPFIGLLATGLALAVGSSGGREGPIVLMGGAMGSLLGQRFGADEERTRAIIGAGAAAGIGASFNAPIAGMLFAIELILGRLSARSLQVVVVGAVVGSVTAREVIGEDVTFIFKPDQVLGLNDPRELLLYMVLGLLAAGLGIAFLRAEGLAFATFAWLRERMWRPFTLAIGGLGVGVVALVVPEVLGTGDGLPPIDGIHDPIQHMLNGDFGLGWSAVGVIATLLLAKFVATMFSVGSGSAVGTFAPTIFTGAALGGTLGTVAATLFPEFGIQPAAFALVGMAAGFSAAARAPLTSILIAFELTGDYGLVLPLMLACGIATFVADRIEEDSVYTHPLHERGIMFGELHDIDVLQAVRVSEVMSTDHPTINEYALYPEIQALFDRHRSHGFVVVDSNEQVVGMLTVRDLERAQSRTDVLAEGSSVEWLTAGDICTRQPVGVHPEQPVHTAVLRMAALDVGRVPVVERGTKRLIGIVRRQDIVRAYQQGLNRHLAGQQRMQSDALRDLAGVQFTELVVHAGSVADQAAVRDVHWPPRTVLTSIRRDGEVVVPTGDTELLAGDELVVLTATESLGQTRALVAEPVGLALDPTDPGQRPGRTGDA